MRGETESVSEPLTQGDKKSLQGVPEGIGGASFRSVCTFVISFTHYSSILA
jgi:hypothetical protein